MGGIMDINLISGIVLAIGVVILFYYLIFVIPKKKRLEKIQFLREFSSKVNMEMIFLKSTFAFAKRVNYKSMLVLYMANRKYGMYKSDFYILYVFLKQKYEKCGISDMASSPLFGLFNGKEKKDGIFYLYDKNENYDNELLKRLKDTINFKIFTGETIDEHELPLFLKQNLGGDIYDYNTFIQFEISRDSNPVEDIVKFINSVE